MITIWTLILLFSSIDNPPGTIRIKDHFVDRTEIQNIHWLEYIHYKSQEIDSIEVKKLLPDSSNVWYSIPDNRYKPIVLITYEQALDYCAWRSKVVSERIGKKVTYRLPTTAEWKDIAEEIIRIAPKQIKKELEETKQTVKKDSGQYILIDREKPKTRIYDMFGNVTEMTLEKGIAMGSNNYELADTKTNLTKLIKYNSANTYLGFRCVAEME